MKFKRVKGLLALGLAVTTIMATPAQASAMGLKDIFNAKYYADTYPDLKEAFGYDEAALYKHFLTYGLKEGRNMNPVLNVVAYRDSYKDLDAAFGDDWDAYVDHFLNYGAYETNRREGVLLDPIAYLEAYGDIKEAFGDDLLAVIEHYQEYGYQEQRTEGTSKGYSDIAEAKQVEAQAAAAPQAQQSLSEVVYSGYGSTAYEYDAAGNILKEVYTSNTSNTGSYGYTYVYTYNGNNDQTGYWYYDKDGVLQRYATTEYDAQGREIKGTSYDADGKVTGYYLVEWTSATESKLVSYNADGEAYADYDIRKHDAQRNVIESTYYDGNGEVISVYTATYNDKKKVLSYKTVDADGEVRESGSMTYYSNGKVKDRTSQWMESKWTESYNEAGSLISSNSIYSDGSSTESYEYYAEGPLKKATREYTRKYSSGEEYTGVEVIEYSQAGKISKQTNKTTYADGSVYEYSYTYNDDGNTTHYESSDGRVQDYTYYESGALKESSRTNSNGSKEVDRYRDAGSYLTDWEERQKYLESTSYVNADGTSKNEQTYAEDGSYVSVNTNVDSEGNVYTSTNWFDADRKLVKYESSYGLTEYYAYYESGALKERSWVSEYGSGKDSYRDAGSYITNWSERQSYLAEATYTSIEGDYSWKKLYNSDGSYTKIETYSNGNEIVTEYDADDNIIKPDEAEEDSEIDEQSISEVAEESVSEVVEESVSEVVEESVSEVVEESGN